MMKHYLTARLISTMVAGDHVLLGPLARIFRLRILLAHVQRYTGKCTLTVLRTTQRLKSVIASHMTKKM